MAPTLGTLFYVVGEELTPVVVLADCLAVADVSDTLDMSDVVLVTEHPAEEVVHAGERGGGKFTTIVNIGAVGSILAIALAATGSRLSNHWWDNIPTLMSIPVKALSLLLKPVTGVVQPAVAKVLMPLLEVVRPVLTVGVVLADGLAVAGVVDVLYMLNQVSFLSTKATNPRLTGRSS